MYVREARRIDIEVQRVSPGRIVAPTPGLIPGLMATAASSTSSACSKASGNWRVSLIGGSPPRKIVDRAMSPPDWSPDGTQMAYLVNVPPITAERHLIVANPDGTNPPVVARRRLPQGYLTLTYRPDFRPL
jgi:hypothetical protein